MWLCGFGLIYKIMQSTTRERESARPAAAIGHVRAMPGLKVSADLLMTSWGSHGGLFTLPKRLLTRPGSIDRCRGSLEIKAATY